MMNQQDNVQLFSSGLELANLIVNSDILEHSWSAISDLYRNTLFDNQRSVKYKVYKTHNVTIIAFMYPEKSSVNHLQNEGIDMASSEKLKGSFEDIVQVVNQSFSIKKTADTIFSSINKELSNLNDQNGSVSPLIITGSSFGGFIASLFAVYLLDKVIQKDTKPPLCITFGSRYLGNNDFQRSISKHPTWNSCFMHVISDQDPVPKSFISSETGYIPFGTFLLCSNMGCACLEEPESILEVLNAMSSGRKQDPNELSRIFDYGKLLKGLKNDAIYKATSTSQLVDPGTRRNVVVNPLHVEISLVLEAIGVKKLEQYQDKAAINSLISTIAKRVEILIIGRRNKFDPTKKLNDMKKHMAKLEWYKKQTVDQGGYYDTYKGTTNSRTSYEVKSREEIVKSKNVLAQYWEKMVEEVNKLPQKEGAAFRKRWLFSGTNYRRLFEPLDIAEYYEKGGQNYWEFGRSKHYKLLEKWINEDSSVTQGIPRNNACSLTEDSCFWAHVEMGVVKCEALKNGDTESKKLAKDELIIFEEYLMDQINNYALSTEVFKHGSSFMQWWDVYINIKGDSYHSEFSDFMKNYQQYV